MQRIKVFLVIFLYFLNKIVLLCFSYIFDLVHELEAIQLPIYFKHPEILSEIYMMPVKLQIAVSRASLVFQKIVPDDVSA